MTTPSRPKLVDEIIDLLTDVAEELQKHQDTVDRPDGGVGPNWAMNACWSIDYIIMRLQDPLAAELLEQFGGRPPRAST